MSEALIHTEVLKDKSLWLAVLAPTLVMVGKVFGLEIDAATVAGVVGPIVGFIISSKLKQASVSKEVIKSAPELESLKKALEDAMARLEVKADESVK